MYIHMYVLYIINVFCIVQYISVKIQVITIKFEIKKLPFLITNYSDLIIDGVLQFEFDLNFFFFSKNL